jgi:hypothetical protein
MEDVCAPARLPADGRLLTPFLLRAPSCSHHGMVVASQGFSQFDLQATIQQAYLAAACILRFLSI